MRGKNGVNSDMWCTVLCPSDDVNGLCMPRAGSVGTDVPVAKDGSLLPGVDTKVYKLPGF